MSLVVVSASRLGCPVTECIIKLSGDAPISPHTVLVIIGFQLAYYTVYRVI